MTPFFAPFLAYAAACLGLLLLRPQFARSFIVRLGIYGGTILALQYVILVGLGCSAGGAFLPIVATLVLGAAPPALHWAYRQAQRRRGEKAARLAAVGLVCAAICLIGVASLLSYGTGVFIALAVILYGLPTWCLEIGALTSYRLLHDYELPARASAWSILGPLAWLGAYGAAWRWAVVRMLEAYADLPAYPPQCYIATAAAHGHPRLVGSWAAASHDGRPFRANRQLQRFKCAELALQAAWPSGHRRLRRIYNTLGPRLARRLHRPFLADGAYLLLKPAEWAAWALLRALVPEGEEMASRLYSSGDEPRVIADKGEKPCPHSNR